MRRLPAAVLIACLAAATPARAAVPGRVYGIAYRFVPPDVKLEAGSGLFLSSFDLEPHTLTAVDLGPDGAPLFDTPFGGVGLLATAPVEGVAALPPGAYAFICRFHATFMQGVLHVEATARRR